MGLEENDLIAEISDQPLMNFFLFFIYEEIRLTDEGL